MEAHKYGDGNGLRFLEKVALARGMDVLLALLRGRT
ncbi:hypothetical protein ABIB73_000371 [Bradyrhizobium sp. F1.4.3]